MADVTITAANILIADDSDVRFGYAGEAVAIGELVFKSTSGQYNLVDIDALTTAPEDPDGSEYALALSATAAAGQPLALAKSGATVGFGGGLTTNTTYYGSTTPGAISDTAPASGDFGVALGTATISTTLPLIFHASGVATA